MFSWHRPMIQVGAIVAGSGINALAYRDDAIRRGFAVQIESWGFSLWLQAK